MAKAIHVARYLIEMAAAEDEPDYLSPLRLQKLLYYVQAWSLVLRGEPMFPERIEAWANGPVIRDVYRRFSQHGFNAIPVGEPHFVAAGKLTVEERGFVEQVWETYKNYSAISLRNMTHQESPWVDAREGYGPADRCEVEIRPEAMRSYFSQKVL